MEKAPDKGSTSLFITQLTGTQENVCNIWATGTYFFILFARKKHEAQEQGHKQSFYHQEIFQYCPRIILMLLTMSLRSLQCNSHLHTWFETKHDLNFIGTV